jgi:hypothetical protein
VRAREEQDVRRAPVARLRHFGQGRVTHQRRRFEKAQGVTRRQRYLNKRVKTV